MSTTRYFYILFSFLAFYSCKEQSLDIFDEADTGASIYFTLPYNTGGNTIPQDSIAIKFGFMPEEVQTADYNISVSAVGPLHNVDRKFKIQISPDGTLKENIHFQVMQESLVIPADKRTGFIKVKVLKTEDMKKGALSTLFELLPNENFNTKIEYRWKSNLQKKVPVLKFAMMVDNKFERPYLWEKNKGAEGYLGEYSFVKLNLIIELFDEELEHFTDPKYTDEGYFTIAKMSYWGSYLKYWLGKEAQEGRIHLDENGKEIKAGPNAN